MEKISKKHTFCKNILNENKIVLYLLQTETKDALTP